MVDEGLDTLGVLAQASRYERDNLSSGLTKMASTAILLGLSLELANDLITTYLAATFPNGLSGALAQCDDSATFNLHLYGEGVFAGLLLARAVADLKTGAHTPPDPRTGDGHHGDDSP